MSPNNDAVPETAKPAKKPVWRRPIVLVLILALLGVGGYAVFRKKPIARQSGTVFTVKRGPMEIAILAGGNVQALESQIVKSEVHGETKILYIVDEGYAVTPDDVAKGKILVSLDSQALLDRQLTQELSYQNANAAYTEARKEYEIQVNQNLSDITSAALVAKFAGMDFEKYMGVESARKILAELGLDKIDIENIQQEFAEESAKASAADAESWANADQLDLNPQAPASAPAPAGTAAPAAAPIPAAPAAGSVVTAAAATSPATAVPAVAVTPPAATPTPPTPPAAAPTPPTAAAPGSPPVPVGPRAAPANGASIDNPEGPPQDIFAQVPQLKSHMEIDFTKYADVESLGDGEAKQMLRKYDDSDVLAKKVLLLANTQFEGTKRLASKDFVTKNDLESERLKVEQSKIASASAMTDKELFMKYAFPKEAETRLSNYEEGLRKLLRAKQVAQSHLAQVVARRNSAKASYRVQLKNRNELAQQILKCQIPAKTIGLVVYGGNTENWRGDDRIQEGAVVRERQVIITIPDMTEMAVKVKVPEASIKSIEKGQKARIRVEAYPDYPLEGEVSKVGILPDAQDRWMNPDVKVYQTTVTIKGTYDWLKPEMNAQVEIIVNQLDDALQVPIQAVVPKEDKRVCYVERFGTAVERPVEVGEFNEQFIEVKSGLKEGERVLLRAPVADDLSKKKTSSDKSAKDAAGKAGKPGEGKTPKPQQPSQPKERPGNGKSANRPS